MFFLIVLFALLGMECVSISYTDAAILVDPGVQITTPEPGSIPAAGNPTGVGTRSDTVAQPGQQVSAGGSLQPPPSTGLQARVGSIRPANRPSTQPDAPASNALPQLSLGSSSNTAPLAAGPGSGQQNHLLNSFVQSGVPGSANIGGAAAPNSPNGPPPRITTGLVELTPNQQPVRPGSQPSPAGFGPIGGPMVEKSRDGLGPTMVGILRNVPPQPNVNGVQQPNVPSLVILGDQERSLAEDIWRGSRKPNRYLIYITDWQRFKAHRNMQFKSYDEEKRAFLNFVKKVHQKIQTDIAKKLGVQMVSPQKKVDAKIREPLNNVLANVQSPVQNQRPSVGPYVRNQPVDPKFIEANQAEPNQLSKKMGSVVGSANQKSGQPAEKTGATNGQLAGRAVSNGDTKVMI